MIPLTVRSHYSLMWGTASVKRICHRAKRLGYDRVALTDTDNLYGLWPFLTACKRTGITPIVGAEVTDPGRSRRAVCLVENDTGYRNLCRLITRRHMDPDFNLETAAPSLAGGLVILTRNAGLLETWHAAGVCVAAAMPRRPLPPSHPLSRTAKKLNIPLVATPGSFFLDPEEIRVHRLMRAIDRNTSLSRLGPGDVAPGDAWLAPPDAYARRFAIYPDALRATRDLAERLTFTGPKFGLVLPPWPDRHSSDRHSTDAAQCLREASYNGARNRYGADLSEAVVERLEHELRIITQMGFAAYFLIVRDIVDRSPRTCGRGSGAASLVAYCLRITNVCPIKHNLYFERFLNPGRKDPPDIDVDFAWDERDKVLDATLTRFAGHAAMVSTHVLFQPRMAIREIAKVYGLAESEIREKTERMPHFWRDDGTGNGLLAKLKERPELRSIDFPRPWSEIIGFARDLIGAPRYLSVHPGGLVITPDPIDAYVPLERAPKGVPVIQWEKDAAEAAGLVKIDLLGNRSLGVIRDALNNLHDNGIRFDESSWEPEDDFATREALAQGNSMGCFYIESPAMRLLQKKSKIGDFEHLVIHSSIIRPAANAYIQQYLHRLHGGEWEPIHPYLVDVLDETFGIMVYQEDVSRVASALAGFSPEEADGLRKIMSKKDKEYALHDFHTRFAAGAKSRGISPGQAEAIWDMMMSFSGYSFCKPHSASYARVSFQAAYFKVHHPAEFIAAVISNQGGFYSTFAYVSEARRMGLELLPPDVNKGDISWFGRDRTVRVGLISVKGLSAQTRKRIVSRRLSGPYKTVRDFLGRVRPDDTEARALILCGALDALHPGGNRAVLMWELARWQKRGSIKPGKLGKPGKPVARQLFTDEPNDLPLPCLPRENERERLRREFAVLGFLCDRHPMELYRDALKNLRAVKALHLPHFVGKRVRLAAWLITGKTIRTKHDDPMEFLTFEDETGIVETTFFPKAYHRFCHMIDRGRPYLLSGRVEQDWGAATLTVDHVERLVRGRDRG